MITHYSLACACIGSIFWYRHREGDTFLGVTPFFHVMGQQQLMCTPLVSGGRVVILSRFVPDVVAQAIGHYRCTGWVAATTMVIALLSLPNVKEYDFSSLRCLVTGGAPISVELQERLKELAPSAIVGEGYGLSETICHGGAVTPLHRYKPGFLGTPQINDIKIMDLATGTKEMGPHEEGEIAIKGPVVMQGYWNNPDETERVLRDGWLYTGDIGLMDEEGFIKLLGRTRELIKCSGYSVFPAEVEDLLYRHPAVQEVAVIGVTDSYRDESPKAFVILKPEYVSKIKESEILEWCKENMAAYKRPRSVEFKQELPKSAAGKVLRRILKEEEEKEG
jgi:long-chain acyl-CoA synthetase